MKILLVISYLLGGQTIDIDILENISMDECIAAKTAALEDVNPITTKHPSHVKIVAECKKDERSASPNNHPSAL